MRNKRTAMVGQAVALVAAGLIMVTTLVWTIDILLIKPTFRDLEHKQAMEDANRVVLALENITENLGLIANDWAFWDDTYAFVQEPSELYITANCSNPAALSTNISIDLLAIIDPQQTVVFQSVYNPELEQLLEIDLLSGTPPPILALVSPVAERQEHVQGMVLTDQGLMLIAARPILDSKEELPPRGVLVMGRFVTRKMLGAIAVSVHVPFALIPESDQRVSAEEQLILDRLKTDSRQQRQIFSNGYIYQLLPDLGEQSMVMLRSNGRGEILAIGNRTSNYLQVVLIITALALLIFLAIYRARMQRSQHSLVESEERYRTLFANHHMVMLLIEPATGRIIDANAGASRFYGWSIEELKRKTITEINTLSPAEIQAEMTLADQEKRNHFLFTHNKADGSTCEVEVYSGPLQLQGKKLLFSIIHDITARRQAERALQESNASLQAIMDSIDAIIYITDMHSHELLFVNDLGLRTFGRDIVGKKCWQALQGLERPCPFCTNEELLDESGEVAGVYRWEFQNLKNNRLYDITDNAIRWPDGRLVRLEIATDITERRQSEAQREELERQLHQAQKVESLGRMAGAVAHHYNNLLGAVIGNLDLALLEMPKSSAPRKYLQAAFNSANRAAEIGKMMLAYLGQTFAKRSRLDLVEVCRQRLADLSPQLPSLINLQATLAEPGPAILGNEEQLGQIIGNLVTNAVESIADRPGTIRVTIDVVEAQHMPHSHLVPLDFLPLEQKYARLALSDTGAGIAESELEKIFDPFYSTKFTGRGLGLPVVAGIVKAHEGCIATSSTLGAGTTFQIYFPLAKHQGLQKSMPGQADKIPALTGTVLLVEDEPFLREVAVNMLTRMGLVPLSARDGTEAVEVFAEHAADIRCVITDLTMPRMDGWQTIEAIRQQAPDMPFVLASGHEYGEAMAGNHLEKPQAFLHKPYTLGTLRRALVKALNR